MNPNAVKHLVILALFCIGAVLFGGMLASQDYENLLLLCYLVMGIYVLAAPGMVPLIAFGLLNPFVLPLPLIYNLPFIFITLAICCVKLFFRNALRREQGDPYRHCLTLGMVLFFGWVGLRYCMHPVMPNLSGFGAAVTGFRSYLNYGICFSIMLLLPFFITNRNDALKLLRWVAGISLFFILLFIPLVFSKSLVVAMWLRRFGLFVTAFDNGWLRFVVLPGFGTNLFILAFFPRLLPASKSIRILLGGIGLVAVVMGGSRSSVVMALIMVLAIVLVQRRFLMLSALVAGTALLLVAFHFIGERLDVRSGVGFWRVLSLTSRRIAEESGAAGTEEWRMIRWKRAMEEIQANPLFGKGYGGVGNAWIFSDMAQFEEASLEIGLATGGIHNGFLNGAYSLGIPALLLFLFAFIQQMFASLAAARRLSAPDPTMSDLHTFVFANLTATIAAIYIGTDLNGPMIWFFLAFEVLLTRAKAAESIAAEASSAKPERAPFLPRRAPA